MQTQDNTQQIIGKYSCGDASSLIDMLQDVQEHFEYLPDYEMQKVAWHVDIPVSRVYGVATFYNQFLFQPLGKYVVKVSRAAGSRAAGSRAAGSSPVPPRPRPEKRRGKEEAILSERM